MIQEEIEYALSKYFNFVFSGEDEISLEYVVEPKPGLSLDDAFSGLYDEIVPKGHYPLLIKIGDVLVIRVTKEPKGVKVRRFLSSILLVATVASVMITGYFSTLGYNEVVDALTTLGVNVAKVDVLVGITFFTLAVVLPIFLHEAGHFFTATKYKVPATFPLPIPAPLVSPLGTFGAIIQLRYLPKNLKGLAELGISGPLVGVSLSMVIFTISYILSPQIPASALSAAMASGLVTTVPIAPLGTLLIAYIMPSAPGGVTLMNPAAEASYLILLVHFANLLPVGQLDGGHVFRSLTSIRTHSLVSMITIVLGILTSFMIPSLSWVGIFMVLAWILSGTRPHYGSANTLSRLSARDKLKYGILYIVLLIMTMPVPV